MGAEGLKMPGVNKNNRKGGDHGQAENQWQSQGDNSLWMSPDPSPCRKKSLSSVTLSPGLSLKAAQLELKMKKGNHLQSQGIIFKIHPHPYVAT